MFSWIHSLGKMLLPFVDAVVASNIKRQRSSLNKNSCAYDEKLWLKERGTWFPKHV